VTYSTVHRETHGRSPIGTKCECQLVPVMTASEWEAAGNVAAR
jgi:hypothetical protein